MKILFVPQKLNTIKEWCQDKNFIFSGEIIENNVTTMIMCSGLEPWLRWFLYGRKAVVQTTTIG
jgi:ABC-type antimicrobial peptide transport system ATPase subunit